nr:Myeloid leukemia factor like [Ipomoea batatas]
MQGGRDPFFGFGDGFGHHRSLMPSVFGGRDPFDDPFFQCPFGGMLESSSFGANGDPFVGLSPNVFHEQQTIQCTRSTGLIIEELSSDDENEEEKGTEKNDNTRKQRRSINEPFVEVPDDEIGERKSKKTQYGNERGWINNFRPQHRAHSFTFHSSSTVTYGDANGTYYTSSRTRRTGSDGLTFEESKEANSATGKAKHKISRGIHDKGHSVMRKLNPDGRVDTMQTLHNLNEDELTSFEGAWRAKSKTRLPGRTEGLNTPGATGAGRRAQSGEPRRGGGWSLFSRARVLEPKASGKFRSFKDRKT